MAKLMSYSAYPFSLLYVTVNWFNVGREHRDLKLGALASLGMSSAVCLFWTVPVAFVASLANVSALRRDIEAIDKLLNAAPWMGPVLEVLAPQLLVGLNSLLPVILLWATNFQGSVSGSVNQASLFTKLAAFTIIQVSDSIRVVEWFNKFRKS
jgi:calcium permeable stress-gated cation channel